MSHSPNPAPAPIECRVLDLTWRNYCWSLATVLAPLAAIDNDGIVDMTKVYDASLASAVAFAECFREPRRTVLDMCVGNRHGPHLPVVESRLALDGNEMRARVLGCDDTLSFSACDFDTLLIHRGNEVPWGRGFDASAGTIIDPDRPYKIEAAFGHSLVPTGPMLRRSSPEL